MGGRKKKKTRLHEQGQIIDRAAHWTGAADNHFLSRYALLKTVNRQPLGGRLETKNTAKMGGNPNGTANVRA